MRILVVEDEIDLCDIPVLPAAEVGSDGLPAEFSSAAMETTPSLTENSQQARLQFLYQSIAYMVAVAKEKLSDIKFPVIVYNEAMLAAFESHDEMIRQDVASVFTKDGGIYTAWRNGETTESLLDYAKGEANEE